MRSSVKGSNFQVSRDVAPDPAQTSLIDNYKTLVAPIASKVVGQITTDVTRTPNEAGESPLGDLIADAQLADDSVVTGGQEPVIAFMNPGGIRADLPFDPRRRYGTPGDITYEEAFSVQPFNNYLVSMTLTGPADLRPAHPAGQRGQRGRAQGAAGLRGVQLPAGHGHEWTRGRAAWS